MAAINFLLVAAIGIIWLFLYKINADTQEGPLPPRINAYEPVADSPVKKIQERKTPGKLQLAIYYEALCPDSERFMQQLAPVYEGLKAYLQLEFVPFGLTKLHCENVINGVCSNPILSCKQGPSGCRANRLHNCVLQYSEGQEKQMKFITCTMGLYKSSIEKCISLLHFSVYDTDTCMTFEEGTELQLKSYNKTALFKPKKLPVLVFDGSYNKELQDAALKDLRVVICRMLANKYKHFNVTNSPTACKTNDVYS